MAGAPVGERPQKRQEVRACKRIYDDHEYWSSFHTELALGRVLDAGTHLVAPLRVTARAKSSGVTITVENLWLSEIADGNFVRAQLYADTAAGRNRAPVQIFGSGIGGRAGLAESAAAYESLLKMAAAGEITLDVDPVPLSDVEEAWAHPDGGRRVVIVP